MKTYNPPRTSHIMRDFFAFVILILFALSMKSTSVFSYRMLSSCTAKRFGRKDFALLSFERYSSIRRNDRWNDRSKRNDMEREDRDPSYTPKNRPTEEDGMDLLYGVNPVYLALKANRRNFKEIWIQTGMDKDGDSKEILNLVKDHGIAMNEATKHDLNLATQNKLHQGYVLKATQLEFENIVNLDKSPPSGRVLALDEVWDPQNFGALIRTSYFLGCDKVVICSKNSAPLSPAVSKASAGAMELMTIHSTANMMKFLDRSKENGWQVVGTSLAATAKNIHNVPQDQPTIIVLGNEGYGMRTNIVNRCDHLVKISGRSSSSSGSGDSSRSGGDVDSLNVSVTGGILLHHFLSSR